MRKLELWFEFASTYSYLTVMRIEARAAAENVELLWRPFLLGPIFKAQGWETSPFSLYPHKGQYMVRDITRTADARGLIFRLPDPFPQNGLTAARLALVGLGDTWGVPFIKAVYEAQFARGENISLAPVLADILSSLGVDPVAAFSQAQSDDVKAMLRARTAEAQGKGIFGAPSFVCADGELFWGDDRMDQALDWARGLAPAKA
jgi:2-hydroxychromene-2-carboxylate isomerase